MQRRFVFELLLLPAPYYRHRDNLNVTDQGFCSYEITSKTSLVCGLSPFRYRVQNMD